MSFDLPGFAPHAAGQVPQWCGDRFDPVSPAALISAVLNGTGIVGTELAADPAAPAADQVVIYVRDDGAGKTELCARFATGAIQVIAAQP